MQYWKVNSPEIRGSKYGPVIKEAMRIYHVLEKKSKRRAYIKTKAFNKRKVFLKTFWDHIFQKNPRDRLRRLRYFACAIELLKESTYKPELKLGKGTEKELWYRLYGETRNKEKFIVQIKETSNKQLYLLSVFPG